MPPGQWISSTVYFNYLLDEYVTSMRRQLATHQGVAESLHNRARGFVGVKNSREYLQLEEQLTALLLLVDGVEARGYTDIRAARKHVVHIIQSALQILENT